MDDRVTVGADHPAQSDFRRLAVVCKFYLLPVKVSKVMQVFYKVARGC